MYIRELGVLYKPLQTPTRKRKHQVMNAVQDIFSFDETTSYFWKWLQFEGREAETSLSDLTRDQRLVILALYHLTVATQKDIAQILGVDQATVSNIHRSFEEFGTPSKRGRSGRPGADYSDINKLNQLLLFVTAGASNRRMNYTQIALALPLVNWTEHQVIYLSLLLALAILLIMSIG